MSGGEKSPSSPAGGAPRLPAAALLALLGGVAGGLANLALEALGAFATLGFFPPLEARFVLAYAAAGAVAGVAMGLAALLVKARPGPVLLVTGTVAMLQAAAVLERVYHALVGRLSTPLVVAGALVALAGFAAWVAVLRFLLARVEASRATEWAFALASVTAAAGLAVNRNVVADVVSKPALVADLAIVAAVAALAWLLGRLPGRRLGIALALAVFAAAALALVHRPPATPEGTEAGGRPHVVLLVIDTLRDDVFGRVLEETAEGRRFAESARGAVRFENAAAAAPWTAPSVASIMTGLWPPEHGYGYQERMTRDLPLTRLSPSVRTLAERLGARGYLTAAWVANPVLGAASGLERGFERFELLNGATSKLPLLTVLGRFRLVPQDLYLDAAAVRRRLTSHLPSIAADPRPAFLWLHLMDPHLPLRRHPGLPEDPAAAPDLDPAERLYRDEVRFTLAEAAEMIELLDDHGLFEEAVFVMVSDHGEMFPSDGHALIPHADPKRYGHGHALYDELTRVPLLVRAPGPRGAEDGIGRSDVLVSHVDLAVTLSDLLGLDLRLPRQDRYSLAPLLRGEAEAARRRFALLGANHAGAPQRALRGERLKLIDYEDPKLERELFDLETDPGERSNLASERAAEAEEMQRVLDLAWHSLEAAEGSGEPAELDAETREQLRALGYLD